MSLAISMIALIWTLSTTLSEAYTEPPTQLTQAPSISPTQPPSLAPSIAPANPPSMAPTQPPSIAPSVAPTKPPSMAPSIAPSNPPSISPTQPPSLAPSITPSNAPSIAPTQPPSIAPSIAPTQPPSPSIAPTQYPSVEPTVIPSLNPTIQSSMTRTIYPSIQPSIIPTTSFQSTEKSLIENIFQNKHLMIVFGISFILFIILFIVICVLCIFKTIKSEKIPQDDHDNDLELQIENTNHSITDEQKLENDDEKQYVNNCGPIVNESDSEGLYVPMAPTCMAQNEKTKMEKEIKMFMFQSKGLHQPKQQQEIEKMKSWFNQKIKLQNDYYQLFVDNGYETLELIVQLLSEDKLRKMGIIKQGHVDKIMMEINSLKKSIANNGEEGINTIYI